MIPESENNPCPCGSGKPYRECCGPFHQGKPASTPEELMRSRYSAFVFRLTHHLQDTWHESARPAGLDLEGSPEWTELKVIDSGQQGNQGWVHFRAVYRTGDGWGFLEEKSAFCREDGRWYYLNGDTSEGVLKPGRNEPCPCGSGRKYKACCL